MASTVKEIIDQFSAKLSDNQELGADINAIIQFDITGDGGGNWWVDFTTKPASVGEGSHDSAACTITMEDQDFIDMMNKEANPMGLFMSGKLKVGGDMALSMKLQNII